MKERETRQEGNKMRGRCNEEEGDVIKEREMR